MANKDGTILISNKLRKMQCLSCLKHIESLWKRIQTLYMYQGQGILQVCWQLKCIFIYLNFSNNNNFIKTKKITTIRRFGYPVLISIDFDDLTLWLLLGFCFDLRRYIKHSRLVSFSNHLKFRQKWSTVGSIFNSLLSVWISGWNTVSHDW